MATTMFGISPGRARMINSWNGSEPPSGLIQHIKRWNKWRKHNCNGRFHKLLVLLGMRKSPTFILTLTDEEEAYYMSYVLHLEEVMSHD